MNSILRQLTYIFLRLAVLLAVMTLLFPTPRLAFAASTIASSQLALLQEESPTQTLLVQFDANTTPEMRDALIAQMGGELVTWMPQINVAEVRLPVQAGVAATALPALASEMVTYAEADLFVSATYDLI